MQLLVCPVIRRLKRKVISIFAVLEVSLDFRLPVIPQDNLGIAPVMSIGKKECSAKVIINQPLQGILIEKISKNRPIVFKGDIDRDNLFEMLWGYNFRYFFLNG